MRWTVTHMDQLERAVRQRRRIALYRRGTEYVVTPVRMTSVNRRDAVVGLLPMTGEELTFVLDELERFQIVE